jgi:hypothetical protein
VFSELIPIATPYHRHSSLRILYKINCCPRWNAFSFSIRLPVIIGFAAHSTIYICRITHAEETYSASSVLEIPQLMSVSTWTCLNTECILVPNCMSYADRMLMICIEVYIYTRTDMQPVVLILIRISVSDRAARLPQN